MIFNSLKILHIYEPYFDHTHPHYSHPDPAAPTLCPLSFITNKPLNTISAVHMLIDIGPFCGARATHQQPPPKSNDFYSVAINLPMASCSGTHPHWNFDWCVFMCAMSPCVFKKTKFHRFLHWSTGFIIQEMPSWACRNASAQTQVGMSFCGAAAGDGDTCQKGGMGTRKDFSLLQA